MEMAVKILDEALENGFRIVGVMSTSGIAEYTLVSQDGAEWGISPAQAVTLVKMMGLNSEEHQ